MRGGFAGSRTRRRSAGGRGGDESQLLIGGAIGETSTGSALTRVLEVALDGGKPVINECGLETSRFRLAADWRIAGAIPAR